MRKLMVAAALASTMFATPAVARDGAPYVQLDLGVLRPSTTNFRLTNSSTVYENALSIRHQLGFDGDLAFGNDFGMFRLEGELGFKTDKLNGATIPTAVLNAYGAGRLQTTFGSDGHSRALSGMINGLVDLGPQDSINASIGAGIGVAQVRYRAGLFPTSALNVSTSNETSFAWQILGELRAPLSSNVDAGVKVRYFETTNLTFGPFCVSTCALPAYDLHGRYRALSVLASVGYNFWSPPPPPPPPPPATQTCPDGSVILATATCPAPPPPPPPPPAPERG